MPETSAARLGLTIRVSASLVAAIAAAGGAWTWWTYGLGAALPFLIIFVVTVVAGWNAATMASRAFRTLRTAEGRLQAAAEALPDGLVVFDRNDRIVFYNSRYPEMMTPALREGLAIGKRFEDWMREGIARGPVYHPDMGEDFLAHRLAMRQGRHSEHAMRIADGRWMRVRDNMMEDGSRVLLITDITEERRRAAELRLLALAVEQAGDPVEITGADHGFTYVNHAFETTTGYSAAEALGLQPQQVLSSGLQPPEFFQGMRRELEAGRTWHGTIINRHRDGHLIEQETTIAPLRDESGATTHFVAVKRDVTEARAQARALAASEARYRAVVDAQTEFIIRVDPTGKWTFMNEAAERYIGMTLEELNAAGHSDPDFILPDDLPVFNAHLEEITPATPTHSVEFRTRYPSGMEHWEHWTDTGIFDETGRLLEIQCIGREITDRKAAELAREEAERLRLAALEAALDCYIATDEHGRIIEFNAAAERTFGYARAEAIGQPMTELVVPPLHRELAEARSRAGDLATWAADILDRRVEVEAMHADGSEFPIELVIVQGERGGSPIFLAYMRDLSERRAAERTLAEREEQFRTIAESVPIGLVISDLETGRPLYINPQSRRNLEVGPDEKPQSLMHVWAKPEQRAALVREVAEKGATRALEVDLVMPSGRRMKALISAAAIRYAGRAAMLAATVDITELRETEAALQESQNRFRAFMDFAPLAAHLRDAEGRYLMFNRRMEELIGVPASEALGKTPMDIRPADVGNSDKHHRSVVETGKLHVSEQYLTYNPDDPRWTMAIRFPVLDAAGRVEAVGTFAVDITDRKKAEAALQASEARLNAINSANPVPMNIVRVSDRRLLFVNEPYLQLFGLESVDLESFDRTTLYPDPDERDWYYAELAAGREVTDHETTLQRIDGTPVPVSVTSRQIIFQGEPAIVTAWADLTALRAAQAEVARSREALHQSEKLTALGALLAGVAHELNNPLSVVVGYSSMLKEIGCDPAMEARVEKIHAAAERCARIVRTFLAMARARPPRREPVALGDVVLGALDLAGYGLRSADIEVELDVSPDLAPVHGDVDQLHQVVVNLVVNAQQALIGRAAPRKLMVRAWAEAADAVLEVADNGPGMAPDVASRVFEPFFTTKPQGVGTGVGLSVCHGIVAAHGGRIELDTARGRGARFRVHLPWSQAGETARAEPAALPLAGGRVLVVDDEPEIAALLKERLAADGLAVATASSGRRALATLESGGIDAVITDLRMPDMDGATLAMEIRRRWPGLAGRIVLITGDALGADPGGRLGARGLPIFEKPLDLAALSAELHRRMSRMEAR